MLELDRLPEHLVVLGGGYVGLEFAQAYRRFGSRVTVIEHGPQLLDREDPDVAAEIRRILGGEGIEVLLAADVLQVEGRSGEGVRLRVRAAGGEQTIAGSDILVATGRTPNTAGIGLELAGVELDARGYVKVNDRLETTAPDVWAIGECAGSPQFTHVSEDDFRIIRDNLAGGSRSTRDRLIPYCLFTDPPLARVGLNEREARQRGIAVRVATLPMTEVLRTRTTGETAGFMKVLVETPGDRILGFTMIGPEAGEVMAVVQTAMLGGLPYTVFRDAILTHPTMAEGLNGLFATVPPAPADPSGGAPSAHCRRGACAHRQKQSNPATVPRESVTGIWTWHASSMTKRAGTGRRSTALPAESQRLQVLDDRAPFGGRQVVAERMPGCSTGSSTSCRRRTCAPPPAPGPAARRPVSTASRARSRRSCGCRDRPAASAAAARGC